MTMHNDNKLYFMANSFSKIYRMMPIIPRKSDIKQLFIQNCGMFNSLSRLLLRERQRERDAYYIYAHTQRDACLYMYIHVCKQTYS